MTTDVAKVAFARSNSMRSLPGASAAEEAEDPARSFMLQTARKSLDDVLAGAGSSKDEKPKEKKGKKKDGKKDKKKSSKSKKKKSSSSSKTSSDDESVSVASCDVDDAASLLGLSKKELVRPVECMRLDDLNTKQMAMVLSGVTELLPASDIYETGGQDCEYCVEAEDERTFCGRAPPNIPLGNAKTLSESAAFLRNLYKKHCRKTGKENVEANLQSVLKKLREASTKDLNNQLKGEAKKPAETASGEASQAEPEPEGEEAVKKEEDDDDEDVFAGKFGQGTKTRGEDAIEKVGTSAKSLLEQFDSGLTSLFPKDLSDMTNWIRMLAKECLLNLDDLKAALRMPGTLSQNLNVGKCYYNKMSMKAKSVLDAWCQSIVSGEAFVTPSRRPAITNSKHTYAAFARPIGTCSWSWWIAADPLESLALEFNAGTSNGSMAAIHWLRERLKQLSECEDPSVREELQSKLQHKIIIVDVHLQEGKPIGELDVDKDAICKQRTEAAQQLVPLRPRLFDQLQRRRSEEQIIQDDASSETPSPGCDYTPTEIEYLRLDRPLRGVLQVHKVSAENQLQGYRYLLRAEELWAMTKRSQHFTNWQDGLGLDIAEAWHVDLAVHIIRKASYKGSGGRVDAGRLKLPFDGVSYVLQSRGCKPVIQRSALQCLTALISACITEPLSISLLPGNQRLPEDIPGMCEFGKLAKLPGGKVANSWRRKSNVLIQADGIPLATATWFILRLHHQEVLQALGNMGIKSVAILCDASPKAKMVWLPVLAIPGLVSVGTLQRLSTLLPSNATAEEKLQVAAMVADSRSSTLLSDSKKAELKKKLPKALNSIRSERLSSRQELKALGNVLSHVNISLDDLFPTHPLAPAKETETRELYKPKSAAMPFLFDRETGASRWDVPLHTDHLRLVVCPDQGGPMFCCYQYLAHLGKGDLLFSRSEASFSCNITQATPDDVLMEMFQRDILKENNMEETPDRQLNFTRVMDILGKTCKFNAETFSWFEMVLLGSHLEKISNECDPVGKNPFKILETEASAPQNQKNYDKVVDLCVKALTNEESFGIFRVARNVLEPFRELCLELVLRLKFRRSATYESILKEGLGLYLATVHELMQYSLYLRSSPHCAAALVSTKEADDGETKQSILKRMEAEWQVVLKMESKQASAEVLSTSCYHTRYQHYRETMGCLEMQNYKMTTESKEMVSAWNPAFCQSASLESMFGEMTHAVKQAGRADCGSLPNLHAVSVRSLFRRVCKKEGSPSALELSKDDWVGPQAAGIKPKVFSPTSAPTCKNVPPDGILKNFPSTSAFCHNQLSLNTMQGFINAQSRTVARSHGQGKEPAHESSGFWVQGCFAPGMLFKLQNKFYVCTGKTPAVLYAVRLKELPYKFAGPLPEQQSVALYGYSLHVCEQALEDKCGSSLLFRRGFQEFNLLCYLVQSQEILKTSSASLSELLQKCDVQMPKTTTKNQKIRRLLSLDAVKTACGEPKILKLLAKLDEQDEKRKRNQSKKEEEGDIEWEELNEDPATAACKELLARLDEEDEQEDAGAKNEDAESKGIPEDANRASRAFLSSSTASLPDELLAEMPLPDGCAMHQTVHVDATLPHFQGRLLHSQCFEGKSSHAASFNPAINPTTLDKRKSTLKSIPANQRSRAQAYYIVWSWLSRATAGGRAAKRQKKK
ncbi:unnamed protein product [Symbiodinium sp. CCMP2592]|nr:unnamed protein product [Symbiodinium sp. CCMP2592]